MQSRKSTAWRKNKNLGQLKGGRKRWKLSRRCNDELLQAPAIGAELPIYIEDNPSKDFYFPISIAEIKQIWDNLPKEGLRPLTYIWLRKISSNAFNSRRYPSGLYTYFNSRTAICLYAWPKDRILRLGNHRPSSDYLRLFDDTNPELFKKNNRWCLKFSEAGLKELFTRVFLHEVGHHVDASRQTIFGRSNRGAEDVAENYVKYTLPTLNNKD